ncbi:MAG: zinc ribbon domain-containing protein [Firmicutes bacterium]|nr:zinc ribbon domain-containing protein [Bacillota bacterium]
MDNIPAYCQSCGMPFDEDHSKFIAKEADGSDSVYCAYCYKDGAFLEPDASAEDMIGMGVPYLAHKIGEKAAREQLSAFVPTLARWSGKS